jgi:hypothetical protein
MSCNDPDEGVFYPDSESLVIGYGTTPSDVIIDRSRDENQPSNPVLLKELNAIARLYQNIDVSWKRHPRDSLLSTSNKLLDLANSVALVSGAGSANKSQLQEDTHEMAGNTDDLQSPQQEEAESQVFDIPNSVVILTGASTEQSETQLPLQFVANEESETQLPLQVVANEESETQLPLQFVDVMQRNQTGKHISEEIPPDPKPIPEGRRQRGRPRLSRDVTQGQALPDLWCECMDIYPDAQEIATALQDPGKRHSKTVNGSQQQVSTFPLIQKICTKIYQRIQTLYNPDGLTKNITRGRESLTSLVLLSRKLTDAMYLDVFFHRFAKNGQVYTITNNPIHCGLDIPIKEFQATILDQIKRAKSTRTSNDGLRLALTLLDPKYRDATSIVMSNRKERAHSDINGDHVLHLFEHILNDSFKNPDYEPPMPDDSSFGDIDETELQQWNPNDPKILEVERDASWLMDTWKVYIKRKYKVALDRWNKETGGGNGQPWSFVNYCDKDARWLVLVFLKDIEANYLLASNAGGRMPLHLQMECSIESPPEL